MNSHIYKNVLYTKVAFQIAGGRLMGNWLKTKMSPSELISKSISSGLQSEKT